MRAEDDTAVEVTHVPRIVLRWSPWVAWEHVPRNVRDGGVRLPCASRRWESGWMKAIAYR